MSSKLVPVSRRELIRRLRILGFDGPFKGSDHDYMVMGETRVTIPNLHKGQDIGVRLLTQVLKEAEIIETIGFLLLKDRSILPASKTAIF